MFGLRAVRGARVAEPRRARAAAGAAAVLDLVGPGETCLVTGPSGSGKSLLLSELVGRARAAGDRVVIASRSWGGAGSVFDAVGGPVESSMRFLARAGLAEPALFALRPADLSDGQRARLAVACALARAGSRALVVIDEFTTGLDAVTAAAVAFNLPRSAPAGVRVVCASSDDRVAAWMGPAVRAELSLDGTARVARSRAAAQNPARAVTISGGTGADYRTVASWHYRAGRPATVAAVLVARHASMADPVGVLVASRPAVIAGWREQAWPGRLSRRRGEGLASVAGRVNESLRTISRVVVDPRWRGVGVATRLVRAYLRGSATPATEAIAAMGPWSGFFATAGMTEYLLPVPERDARLADALHALGLGPADLLHGRAADRLDPPARRLLDGELRRWASRGRLRRDRRARSGPELAARAAMSILCRPRAYAHGEV